jgi:hypothetical protein
MKFVTRTPIPIVAALCLAASVAAADELYRDQTGFSRVNTATGSRLTNRTAPETGPAQSAPEQVAAPPAASESKFPAENGEPLFDAEGDCDGSCDCNCWADGRQRCGLWYGSVDYLLARPRFSQATAEDRRIVTTDNTVTPNTITTTDQSVQFPFRYQSSFRTAIGYRLLDCGGDFQVAYWRLTGASGRVSDGPATSPTSNPFLTIIGQTENNAGPGQFFSAVAGVTANVFDVDFAKCLAFGGPQHPCDCCYCPRWDLRWSAGARFADVSRFDSNAVTDGAGNFASLASVNARFVGGGLRGGLQGRRYFGEQGRFSVYAKASQALLVGNYRITRGQVTPGSETVSTNIIDTVDTFARLVPVTDIEIGGTWQIAPYTFISAGWFLQCWWDLGQSEVINGVNGGPLDSSNILGFDGLFIRGEMLF